MKKKTVTVFDKTAVFKEKITPLLDQINEICRVEDIPYVYSFCTKSEPEKTHFETNGKLTGSEDIVLYDDKLKNVLLALADGRFIGFDEYQKELDEQMEDLTTYICEDGEIIEEVVSVSK